MVLSGQVVPPPFVELFQPAHPTPGVGRAVTLLSPLTCPPARSV
ncbi:hypothetical protein ABGB18_11545 [Nonomuraea sp. B12E4]